MVKITEQVKQEVQKIVYDFFAEECEVDRSELNENTNIVRDIDGDSLMFLELIEIFKGKYREYELYVQNPVHQGGKITPISVLKFIYFCNSINCFNKELF